MKLRPGGAAGRTVCFRLLDSGLGSFIVDEVSKHFVPLNFLR